MKSDLKTQFLNHMTWTGHLHMTIELKDKQVTVLYATISEAALAIGFFDGYRLQVTRKKIVGQ